jgi:hypothetical protein
MAFALVTTLIVAWPAALALASTDPSGTADEDLGFAPATSTVDTEAPTVSVEDGPSGPTNEPRPTFSFSSPDDSATFHCSIDAGTPSFGPCLGYGIHQPPANLADGAYVFHVEATDPAGNSTGAERVFSVDTRGPSVSVDSGPSGPTDDPRPSFAFSSPDASVTFACSIDTGTPSFAPCSDAGTNQPSSALVDGAYTFRVQATDPAGNSTTAERSFEIGDREPPAPRTPASRYRGGAPQPVPAWYMTALSSGDLRRQARSDICAFARRQPNRTRALLLDFGKADKHHGRFGAQLRLGTHFSNGQILDAMKAAADAYRSDGPCYSRGSVRITYGNTNNMRGMDRRSTRKAGRRQATIAHRLERYARSQGAGFSHVGVAVAGDIEPQWNPPPITKDLVDGATRHGRGGLYLNYGAASGCPPESSRCYNQWTVRDLGKVSYGGVRRSLPEIYERVHAKQWTRVRQEWNQRHRRRYCFYGTTATPGFPLRPRQGWRRLRAKNRCVKSELVNIRDN